MGSDVGVLLSQANAFLIVPDAQFLQSFSLDQTQTLARNVETIMQRSTTISTVSLMNLQAQAEHLFTVLAQSLTFLTLKTGAEFDDDVMLNAIQSLSIRSGLGFDVLVAIGAVQAITTDEDSAVGGFVRIEADTQQVHSAITTALGGVDLNAVQSIAVNIQATLEAALGLDTVQSLTLVRSIITDVAIIYDFEGQFSVDFEGPGDLIIETSDDRIIKIGFQDRYLRILVDKRAILIDGGHKD